MADQVEQKTRTQRRSLTGQVVSDVRDKTIKVSAEELIKHPRYGKYVRRRTLVHVHDENNDARIGDQVEIMETRPISKTKNWRLVNVVRRAAITDAPATEK